MAFSSQQTSVRPKMGRTTVDSSIFRGSSATIKVPKGMGYTNLGSRVDPKFLPKKPGELENTLTETNSILVQIQNTLAADYAYRIASEKQQDKILRAEVDEKRRSRREGIIEGGKKIGRAASNIVSTVTAPARSLFDKIFGFLSNVLTGFIVNKALEWLSKKENQEKVNNVFNFLKDNWKVLLGISAGVLGGIVVAKVISKLYTMYRITKGLLRLFGIGRGRGGSGDTIQGQRGSRGGGLFRRADGSRRGIKNIRTTQSRIIPGKYNVAGGAARKTVNVITRKKGLIGKALQLAQVGVAKFFKKSGLKLFVKALRPFLKRIPIIGALLDFGLSLAMGESVGRAGAKAIGALLGGVVGSALGPIGSFGGAVAGDMLGAAIFDMFAGGAQGMNRGGTVPGGGPNRDSVLTYLTPGEKVVPRDQSSKEKFGPFIDDIIYNQGTLYGSMVYALKQLDSNTNEFAKINKKFAEILEQYGSIIAKQNTSSILNNSGNGDGNRMPPPPVSAPAPSPSKAEKLVVKSGGEGGMNVIPLKTIHQGSDTSGMQKPQIPTGNDYAKYGAVDPSNEYIPYVIREFGILMGG